MAVGRRQLLLGAGVAALLGGCGFSLNSCNQPNSMGASPDDIILGQANAPATLIEYASSTCPHCAEFHEAVWDQLKANYIDTGKLRYIFREYPTAPAAVAVAGFQVARCGGASPDQYMTRLGELFRQQRDMFASGSMEGVRAKFVEIGAAAGLSEEQVMQCVNDQSGVDRIQRIGEAARPFGVDSTPTLILNGTKLEDPRSRTYAGLASLIDAAIAQHN